MEKFIVEKSPPLKGKVKIGGSKNSALPILAASLLTQESCTIKDIPKLQDIDIMKKILEDLGATVIWDEKDNVIHVQSSNITKTEANTELINKIRASFLIMGPLLARYGYAKVALPGGCCIGARPVDLHLKGFHNLGAEVIQEHGYVIARANMLKGAKIYLDFPSVGATENIMMASVYAEGQTVIENCAIEPEIVDLANFLNSLGAQIKGAGTDTIKINGVKKLQGAEHTIIPDRIEAGTFMIAAAITNGDIILENVLVEHLKPIIAKLKETNVNVEELENALRVYKDENTVLKGVDIKTMPYPSFPTDMQAQFMSLLLCGEGSSMVTETVFENRFMHVSEFKRMGAEIKIDSRTAFIEGKSKLSGASVKATDLRAGAALVLAALNADGITEISDIHHIDRGYCSFDEKIRLLGGKITRMKSS